MKPQARTPAVAGQRLEAANRQTEAACLRSYRSDVDCGTDICMARPQPATQQRLRICGTEFGDDDRYRIHSVNVEPADSCMNFSNTLCAAYEPRQPENQRFCRIPLVEISRLTFHKRSRQISIIYANCNEAAG